MKQLCGCVAILMFVTAAGFFRTSHSAVGAICGGSAVEPLGSHLGSEVTVSRVTIESLTYRGWQRALRISNGHVEAIVVPAIGRVMRFGWVGDTENMLWENSLIDGSSPVPIDGTWNNFGGDKVWPSPQSQWPQVTSRAWPPPSGFDSLPYMAEVIDNSIVLTSKVDPHYGIQTVRRISMTVDSAVMTIASSFHKVSGMPVEAGVWTITQVPDAVRVYALLPAHSAFDQGNLQLSEAAPASLKRIGQLLSLSRSTAENVKIGMDSRSMLWVGKKNMLRIDAEVGNGVFPDNGCRTEIYTNADPLPYIEMETMGPLLNMKAGDVSTWSNSYKLIRRTQPTADAEAATVFGLGSAIQ